MSKGGTRARRKWPCFGQFGTYPRASFGCGFRAARPLDCAGLPFLPFAVLAACMFFVAVTIPRKLAAEKAQIDAQALEADGKVQEEAKQSVKDQLRTRKSKSCSASSFRRRCSRRRASCRRVSRMRRSFAKQYGFVVPEIRITDDMRSRPRPTRSRSTLR